MTILEFPPVSEADENGLLAIGGDLEVDSLLLAYRQGIFPWPVSEQYLTWFAPPKRAVLEFSDFHIPKSLLKEKRKNWAKFAFNLNFENVIAACQELTNRKDQSGTWITPAIRSAYINLHQAGHAHSVECYLNKKLVGGLYGVAIGQMFAAESMFYRHPGASKLCLWFLIDYLSSKGLNWIDIQVMTPLLAKFGAKEIDRERFSNLLAASINQPIIQFENKYNDKLCQKWEIIEGLL